MIDIKVGDALDVLRTLDAGSVHCCVTSPPYWGLRDYGTAVWEGGDPDCEHAVRKAAKTESSGLSGGKKTQGHQQEGFKVTCPRCGAKRIDSQLGLEPAPHEYVDNIVAVMREVRRVLRDDGTLWLNLGDSYASAGGAHGGRSDNQRGVGARHVHDAGAGDQGPRQPPDGLKSKDLVGVPWMVAFALRADGWYLRRDIIWAKPNPMPESVTDRPTSAHEYLFLLTKSARYFYDAEAIREDDGGRASGNGFVRDHRPTYRDAHGARGQTEEWTPGGGRNKRSVWTIATRPFAAAHFATFPPDLVEPCVLAGTSPKCCGECGAPWQRVLEPTGRLIQQANGPGTVKAHREAKGTHGATSVFETGFKQERRTIGWKPTCEHKDESARAIVLDPFSGAATTGLVAAQHGRDYLGIELNPEYVEMGEQRIRQWEANPNGSLTGDPEPIPGQIGLLEEMP